MKKITLLVVTLFFIYGASAQEEETVIPFKTKFGVKGGVSFISDINNEDYYSTPYIGVFAETRLSRKWSLQNEVLFSPTDSFLEIPILIKYHINDKFEVFLGPKLDLLLDNSSRLPNPDSPINLSAEAGIQYNISKRFFVEGRYSKGLTDPRFGLNRQGAIDTFKAGIGFKF